MDSKKSAEFSSRTMLNILCHGAAMHADDQYEFRISLAKEAHIPLSTKREFIDQVIFHYGLEQLLLLGDGVKKMLNESTVALLVHRSSPPILLTRWQRLEKYIRSSHRINITRQGERKISLQHVVNPNKEPPLIGEDLVVLGVLMTLLGVVGAKKITLYTDKTTYPVFEYGNHKPGVFLPSERPVRWVIEWSSTRKMESLKDTTGKKMIANGLPDWPQFAHETANAIINTSVLIPRLEYIASYILLSRRTLQRRLKNINISFSKIAMKTKVRLTATWLVNSTLSMAEIGFISGFSDQPHFNRAFKKLIGMPPRKFQKLALRKKIKTSGEILISVLVFNRRYFMGREEYYNQLLDIHSFKGTHLLT